jgi:hypothetical protein
MNSHGVKTMADDSIFVFMESIRSGWGDRFANAFNALGLESMDDLRDLEDIEDGKEMLDSALTQAGAKPFQLSKIHKALGRKRNLGGPTTNDRPDMSQAATGVRDERTGSVSQASVAAVAEHQAEGWLLRQRKWVRSWRRRWVMLSGSSLYISRQRNIPPHVAIDMSQVSAIDSSGNPALHLIKICMTSSSKLRDEILRAESTVDFERWTAALSTACAGAAAVVPNPSTVEADAPTIPSEVLNSRQDLASTLFTAAAGSSSAVPITAEVNGLLLVNVTEDDIGYVKSAMSNLACTSREEMCDALDENLLTMPLIMQALEAAGAGLKSSGLATKIRRALRSDSTIVGANPPALVLETNTNRRDITAAAELPQLNVSETRRSSTTKKKFAAFLSHHKRDSAMEARWVKQNIEPLLDGAEVFLDSDNLQDLTKLLNHVIDSEVLVLMQTSEIIARPWMILEVHAAVTHEVPIVALYIRGKGCEFSLVLISLSHRVANRSFQITPPDDFDESPQILSHLDTQLDQLNPGASKVLRDFGVEPIDAAHLLSQVIPNIISIELNTSASEKILAASMQDLAQHLRKAQPCKIQLTKEEWLEHRAINFPIKPKDLAVVPPEIPELPRGFVFRPDVVAEIHECLFPSSNAKILEMKNGMFVVHGMGGSGKTVVVSSAIRSETVRSRFDRICFVGIGQEPNLRDLQRSLHMQLSDEPLDASTDDSHVLRALQNASRGKTVLLVIDDPWEISQVRLLNCIDTDTNSRMIITTRIQGLVPEAPEVPLGLMSPDLAVRIIYDVAGIPQTPPYSDLAYQAAAACGHLPLALGVAGGMLLNLGGKMDEEYLQVLTEDHGEVLREGEFGDLNVKIEDRIITGSLKQFRGSSEDERERVVGLFTQFAMFPEVSSRPWSNLLACRDFNVHVS